jgi:apolipoprotein N-acyltransferase
MALHPLRVARDFLRSGVWGLLEPLLFLPLAGFEWGAGALPALVPYAIASNGKLSHFALYYSMPILPFLFAGAACGLRRVTRRFSRGGMLPLRAAALLLLLICALDGAGYKFERARPEREEIAPLLATIPARTPALLQGALLPHAGYDPRFSALDLDPVIDGSHAFLLDPGADSYPFTREGISRLADSLKTDRRYGTRATRGGLLLFLPAR